MASDDEATTLLRQAAAADPEVQVRVRDMLSAGAPLESIVLTADGRWLYQGRPVGHPRVVALFHRSVRRTAAGTWLLAVGPYVYPVTVERTGWFIARLLRDGREAELLGGEAVEIGAAPEARTDGETIVDVLLPGDRWARVTGAAYQQLGELLDVRDGLWVVRWPWGDWTLTAEEA